MSTLARFTLLSVCATMFTLVAVPCHAQVFRCGHSYSDAPCLNGATVEIQPPVEVHGNTHNSTVFLCRLAERQFWSAQSCQSHNATMLRSQSVPQSWTWERQWRYAEREWRHAEQQTSSQAPLVHRADTSALAQRRRARPDCTVIEQRIRQLDEMGRRGGSASHMERIRSERKAARDQQFRAGC
ncbi:hypothetical protein [Comamonas sp. NoAH]|uniref:hypothetical protein n=1 Tax=Comamonas halotolerans TaxID=3041496 RepID=UPI0024E0468A|nr:hypothetical protein [Comamonas sp. NoAH]